MSAVARVATSSFSDRIARLLELVDYRRVDSAEDRETIYRLRYDAYLREGSIPANFAKRFADDYDEMPNVWTFGVYVEDRLASSFRMHVSTPDYRDIPALHVFPDVLSPLIDNGKIVVDPTRFVADPVAARQYPELPYVTVRLGHMAGEYFKADYVLATVRAEHQAFYKRVFGHHVVCPPRPYPTLTKPISLMIVDAHTEREHILRRYPMFRSTQFEKRMLFDRPKSAEWQADRAKRTAAA
jgi:hypothetical protein